MATASASVFSEITPGQKRTFIAASLGWMLDAFDVMLYSLILARIMVDLNMTKGEAGALNTLTLVASGLGGLLFGFIADRIGRTRALALSILTYSFCSFASGLSTTVLMLAIFRFILGLGMGGEWNTGATLVAETWPTHLRARALALVQSSWAIGFALAALVAWVVLLRFQWRTVFFVGVAPALCIFWIQSHVPESELWREHRRGVEAAPAAPQAGFGEIFSRPYLKKTIALLLLNFFGMFAWWGLFTWVPSYFVLPVAKGGLGFNDGTKTILLVVLNLTGMLPGYASFGWVADWIGRRKAFMLYTLVAALLVPIYAAAHNFWTLLALGTPIAFFGTGFFSGSAITGSELFPTHVRARALGFTYNGARMMSSIAPFVIGYVAERHGLSGAFLLCAASFFIATIAATQLPETRGQSLT
jgi:MFS family permease